MSSSELDVDLSIREAKMEDAAALASLMGELGYPTTEEEMEARLQAVVVEAGFRTFVAIRDDEVCGMIGTLAHASHEHNDLSGRIVALVVSKSLRRQGIARKLIAVAEEDFAARKVTRIALTTRLTREDAHRFYEELGYTRNGYRYVKDLAQVEN